MYTDDDLNNAVENGIFTQDAVDRFRRHISESSNTSLVDEENIRLVTSFNDIFVVIACVLLLASTLTILSHKVIGLALFTLIAWGLAEFFVRKRKMAFPAIILLLSFVGGAFFFVISAYKTPNETSFAVAAAFSAIVAYLHWKRFMVPITIAAGTAAVITFIIATILSAFSGSKEWINIPIFLCGIASFIFAMYWDISDRLRVTRRSDVAFWLHLLSAPLIIHPVLSKLGVINGKEGFSSMILVLFAYLLMTLVSLIIDRRAFMVSSLGYVIFALANLFKVYGIVNQNFAITGAVIGSALLLLSAFWHTVRVRMIALLPEKVQEILPPGRHIKEVHSSG